MRHKKTIYILIIMLVVISLILAGMIWFEKKQGLRVVFLDVGQGDAILIMQGSTQILIDGGPSGQILMEKLGRYVPFWDREIETIIATHPDQDHIEGLLAVMKNYRVGALVETTVPSESQLYLKYQELIAQKQIQKIPATAGLKIKIDQVEMEVLVPWGEVPTITVKDTNSYSVVTRLVFGQNSFLFTGDLPGEEERKMLEKKIDLQTQILKISHHGSKHSSLQDFLEAVEPREAIISVGKNNRYGHPAPEIIDRLRQLRVKILRTDEMGDIKYDCLNISERCVVIAN